MVGGCSDTYDSHTSSPKVSGYFFTLSLHLLCLLRVRLSGAFSGCHSQIHNLCTDPVSSPFGVNVVPPNVTCRDLWCRYFFVTTTLSYLFPKRELLRRYCLFFLHSARVISSLFYTPFVLPSAPDQ